MALDFDYRQQMIYWTDVTTQGSMIRRMYINGSDVQVSRVFFFIFFFFNSSPRWRQNTNSTRAPSFARSCIAHR